MNFGHLTLNTEFLPKCKMNNVDTFMLSMTIQKYDCFPNVYIKVYIFINAKHNVKY